jgi:hypothetical protein
MPRVAGEKQYNSFVKGLITEASPLTFPENAFLDGTNIVLNRDGSIARRLGIDYEDGYVKINSGYTGTTLLETEKSFHKWNFAGGSSDVSLGVVRVKDKLFFLDMTTTSPSSSLKNGGDPVIISGLGNSRIEAIPINNGLVVVSEDLDLPVYLEYNPDTDDVTQSVINIKVRDFWGVYEDTPVDLRPTTLTDVHKYNLYNQGWPVITGVPGSEAVDWLETSETSALVKFYNDQDHYPSNADVWTLGKKSDSKFSASLLVKNSFDKAPAPKGKYIIDIYNRGASRTENTGITGLPLDRELGRLSTVTAYSGRVAYAGITSRITGSDQKSPNYSGYIFFTKTVANKDDLGICYQEADPTSEYISDIIDTDGGTITIPESNKIRKLATLKNSLVVFAENGIWEIFGSDYGFKATDYQLNKVTNIGISNPKSVVVAGDVILYWAKNGIYALSVEPQSGRLVTQNISLTTIQTFYNELATTAREAAKGFYDQKENRVRWLYSEESDDEYHKELILDLELQAFFPNTISRETVFIADYVEIPNYINSVTVEDVYVGSDLVVVGTDTVQVDSTQIANRDSPFSFLIFTDTGYFTLGKYNNTSFVDWEVEYTTGVDYDSYIITGYELFGDITRKKQATYLVTMFERTETGFEMSGENLVASNPSSCLVQAQWNWTNSATSGKWGTQFQAYRYNRKYIPSGTGDTYNTGDRVIVSRNKLRGSGRALSLYFQSEIGKDMKLLGWAIPMSGTGVV